MSKTTIAPEELARRENIAKGTSVEYNKTDNKIVATVAPDLFLANLPAPLTPELVASLGEYRSNYIHDCAAVLNAKTLPIMAAHPKVDSVEGTFPLDGKDTWTGHIDRFRQFVKPGSTTGEKVDAWGHLSGKIQIYDADTGRGVMRELRESMRAAYSEKLAPKK